MRIPAAVVVFAGWSALSAAAVWLVVARGVNFPYMDEWTTLDALAAPAPPWGWFAERHNEHVLPLPRLVYWGAFRLTGDLRAGMLLTAGMLAAAAGLLADAARRVRGRASLSDLFFPAVLLNWSQYENLLMSYQVCFALSTLFAAVVLRAAALGPNPYRVWQVGACAALLPLCGGHGLILAVPAAGWLAGRRRPLPVALAGLSALAAVWAVAVPASPAGEWVPPATGKTIAVGLLGFATSGYGLAGWDLWPWLAVVPVAAFTAAAWAAVAGRRQVGVAGFVVGMLLLAGAVAWGRGRYGAFATFFPRYTTFAALLPAGFYFAFLSAGGRFAGWGPAGLAAVAVGLLPLNTRLGWDESRRLCVVQRRAEKDLRAGMPVEVVAERTHFLTFPNAAGFALVTADYADKQLGRLRALAHLPPAETERFEPTSPAADGWVPAGPAEPRVVYAIRVKFRFSDDDPHRPARVLVAWREAPGGPERVREEWVFHSRGEHGTAVWVDGPACDVRVRPGPATVTAVEFLVPVKSTPSTGTGPAPPPR